MIRRNKLNTPAIMAISAAILCSSSVSFAQETAPLPTAQSAAPVTVEPTPVVQTAPEVAPPVATVAPPPAVRTIPESAAEQRVAITPAPVAAAAKRPAPRRIDASQASAPRAVEVLPVTAPVVENATGADFAPATDNVTLGDGNVEDIGTIAPANQSNSSAVSDGTQDDWMIYGGLAAALGLAGLGGAVASRRRRTRRSEYRPIEQNALATTPASNDASLPVAAYREPRFIKPTIMHPLVADRHLPAVTDPLFAHQAKLAPITDPLFYHQTAMPPVTDPMFADHNDYAGNVSAGSAFDKRRSWPATPGDHNPTVREMEPAE